MLGLKKEEDKKEEKPEEIIKKYKLKEGDYRLKIRFLEGSDLIPPKAGIFGGGILNPYAVAEVLGGKLKKRTKHKEKTLSPLWNETFIMELKAMKKSDLEEGVIKFSVYDRGRISDSYLGSYELDITSIYFSLYHQLNEVWLALTDLTDEREGCLGYLKVSLELLGPDDEPVIPPEKPKTDSENAEKNLFMSSKVKQTGHTISLDIYRGECLAPLDLTSLDVDAFVTAKYAGVIQKSDVITSQNPIWNQNLQIGAMLPNNSKFLLCEVWDRDLTSANDLVGCFRVPFKDFQNKRIGPFWVNLYGPPLSAKECDITDYMAIHGYEAGSHFRGRIMYSVSSWDENDPKTLKRELKFQFPENPEPVVPCRTYMLRVDIYEGCELPQRDFGIVHVGMGPYLIKTKPQQTKNCRCLWYESLPDKKVVFPDDPDQLPDIIIYFADKDSEDRRHSFARLKAKDFLNQSNPKPILIKLKEDRSLDLVTDDEFPGFIFAKIELLTTTPPPRQTLALQNIVEEKYELRVYLYIARGLPPSDNTGTSDPFAVVRCAGQMARSSIQTETLNPNWFETLVLDVDLPPFSEKTAPPGLSLILYDSDDDSYEKRDLLGRTFFIIQNQTTEYVCPDGSRHQVIYSKPAWHNVRYDVTDQVMGKVLVGYTLMKKEVAEKIPVESIYPEVVKEQVFMFLIGLRDIDMGGDYGKVREANIRIDVPKREDQKKKEKLSTVKAKVKHSGLNINELYPLDVEVPTNKEFCPLINIYSYAHPLFGGPDLMGIGSISLMSIVKHYHEKPSKIDSHFASELLQLEEAIKNAPMDVSAGSEEGTEIPTEIPTVMEPIQDLVPEPTEDAKKKGMEVIEPPKGPTAKDPNVLDNSIIPYDNKQVAVNERVTKETLKAPVPISEMNLPKNVVVKQQPEAIPHELNFGGADANHLDITPRLTEGKPLLETPKGTEPRPSAYQGFSYGMGTSMKPAKEYQIEVEKRDFETKQRKPLPREIATVRPGDMSSFEGPSKVSSHAVSFNAFGGGNKALGRPLKKPGAEEETKKKSFGIEKLKGLGLFSRFRSEQERFTYEDYDTDPDENLSVIPDWMKRRGQFNDDLEDSEALKKSAICVIPLTRGQTRGLAKNIFGQEKSNGAGDVREIAYMKCVFIPESAAAPQKVEKYKAFMSKSKPYLCGLYILRGIDLVSPSGDAPDTYLVVKYGDTVIKDKEKSLRKAATSPDYYCPYKFNLELPGSSTLRIEVWADDSLGNDDMIGYTEIDMENRFFSKRWLSLKRKPIEMRNIRSEYGTKSQGRLEMFVELYKDPKQKIWDVKPLPVLDFELRVIVWKTRDCVFKDEAEKCNDLFVRGGPATQEFLETDTHWRCRAEGSFNWRWKYKMSLPLKKDDYGGDRFIVQLWDRDIAAANDLIGECEISLNLHKMLDKAYKRKKATRMMRKWVEKEGQITDRLWFEVFHPEIMDENGNKKPQGKVQLSFELIPLKDSEAKVNANGRDAPNNYPVLPEPTGRLSFDITNPLQFIKDIIGPDLYRKCWMFVCLFVLCLLCVFFIVTYVTSGVGKITF